jgi:hypothetical protein
VTHGKPIYSRRLDQLDENALDLQGQIGIGRRESCHARIGELLYCGVYAEGTVLSVEIESNAEVNALQEAVAVRFKHMSNRVTVYPAMVTLYLARKNGVWLKSGPNLKPFLKQGRQEDSECVVEMIPNWKLDDPEYFGDVDLGEESIQVLVQLPEAVVARESSVHQMRIEMLLEQVFISLPTKRQNPIPMLSWVIWIGTG